VLPNYLLVGHITADITPQGRLLGGTVSYATPVAKCFNYDLGIITSGAPNEPLFDILKPYLADYIFHPAPETSTFENIYHQSGRTQYLHHRAAPLTPDLVPEAWRGIKLVHLAPLTDEVDPALIDAFPDATIMVTPQGWMRQWGADKRVFFKRFADENVLRRVDMVVMSKQDIVEAPELEQEYAPIVKHLFVTDGANGGTYYHYGTPHHYEAYPVEEIEPTGAGDVFATALLASLPFVNHDMLKAVQVAARLAAFSVTRHGIENTVTADEVQAALAAVQ
jgi:sugar/nucleoside kinase (ribokinase family)